MTLLKGLEGGFQFGEDVFDPFNFGGSVSVTATESVAVVHLAFEGAVEG